MFRPLDAPPTKTDRNRPFGSPFWVNPLVMPLYAIDATSHAIFVNLYGFLVPTVILRI
jgi:hypothetical protein